MASHMGLIGRCLENPDGRTAIVKNKQAIVTEGYTDVIACHAAGITNVVGTLGTALTDDHARKLARLGDRIVLIFDGDDAGQNAAERAVRNVFRHPVDVAICALPDGLDPDDLLSMDGGQERFRDAVDNAVDAIEFLLARFRDRLDSSDGISAGQRVLEQFIESLRGLGLNEADGLRRSMLVNQSVSVGGRNRWIKRPDVFLERSIGILPSTCPRADLRLLNRLERNL